MLKLNACPRCYGDVVVDRDQHGWYEECLQCGYHRDLLITEALEQAQIEKGRTRHV